MNHGRQNIGPASAHKVSNAMATRKITQPVPVTMFRPGTGQLFQPNLLAHLGPPMESMNGNKINASTPTVGMTIDIRSSGPSLMNWKRNRKYQSGRGMVTARGSADASSWRFFWMNQANAPTSTIMNTMITGYGQKWSGKKGWVSSSGISSAR